MKLALVALAAIGCGFPRPSEDYACTMTSECTGGRVCDRGFCVLGQDVDAAIATDATLCASFSARHFDACAIPPPGGDLSLSQSGTYVYDTDTGMLSPPTGTATMPPTQVLPSGRLVSVQSLSIATGTTLRVVGTLPLVVASWSSITVSGTIDVSSNINGAGAGANPTDCNTHAPTIGGDDLGGGGGGGGAGFQGIGGSGGIGNTSLGLPGSAGGTIALPLLRGGCKGATGGAGDQSGGLGGNGGGAVQLTAKQDITIGGAIHAGGAGGEGATIVGASGDGGGGGGGSGGMIGLEGATITLLGSSTLAANGGGGGEGSDTVFAGTQRGSDAIASANRALGGTGTAGGDGGLGSGGVVLAGGPGADDADGGGGGGGGAGYIAIKAANLVSGVGTVSPPVTAVP